MSDLGIGADDMLYELDDTAKEFLGLEDEDMSDIMTEVFKSVEEVEKLIS
ncbi:MAG: hypothetical protein JRL30_26240 [Deltaproteobacteria bacterium]|nr:hypothetical protein [Deltaproteobacteria bacterium]